MKERMWAAAVRDEAGHPVVSPEVKALQGSAGTAGSWCKEEAGNLTTPKGDCVPEAGTACPSGFDHLGTLDMLSG